MLKFAAPTFLVLGWLVACSHGRPVSPLLPDHDAALIHDAGGKPSDAAPLDGGADGAGGAAAGPECPPCPLCQITAQCSGGWCLIPGGCFVMGSPGSEWGRAAKNEEQALVTLTRPFLIQQLETTQGQWSARGYANPSGLMKDGLTGDCTDNPNCPLGNVTWFEGAALANALSEAEVPPLPRCYTLTGCSGKMGEGMTCDGVATTTPSIYDCGGIRLPTDAEWEYAARGGTRTAFYSGDISPGPNLGDCYRDSNLDRVAWYCQNAGPKSHIGGQKDANAWGLFDMSGNVEEWVNDVYTGTPPSGPLTDPGAMIASGASRAVRGGLFNVWPSLCRSAAKLGSTARLRGPGLGLRLVKPAPSIARGKPPP